MKKLFYLALAIVMFPAIAQDTKIYTQTVRGVAYDKNLSTPLGEVSIIIMGTSPLLSTLSDSTGKFKIENVPVGRYDIKIQLLGYKTTLLTNQLVNSGKETVLEVYMEEEILEKEFEIKGERDKTKPNNGLITGSVTNLRTEEINRFAGSRSDPSRMASNYAGVAGGGDQRNDIIVRGNSPVGVLWRLEGVDIPNPNHFTSMGSSGGAFCILNNNLLSNSDFLTGAFPSEYGNKTAAVFDVKMRNGNNEKRENTFQLGLSGIEFTTEGPISKKAGSSYMASYRFFTFEALKKLGVSIGANGVPQYQDFTMKVNMPTKKLGTFTAWGIMGTSSIDLTDEVTHPDSTVANPSVKYESTFYSNMFATGISNEYRFSEKTKGKLIISASGSKLGYKENDIQQSGSSFVNVEFSSLEGQYLANYTLSHKFNSKHFVKGGVIMRNMFYNNNQSYFDYDDSTTQTPLDQRGNTWMAQAFVHWHFRATDKLSIHPGLYYQQFMLNNSKALEPRLAIAYALNSKNSFSIASGLHSQTLPLFIYQSRFKNETTGEYYQPNKNLDFMRSIHLVASYRRAISTNLRFKMEAYYQYLYDVPVSTGMQDWYRIYSIVNTGASYGIDVGADSSSNKGKGRNYGVEISLEKYFSKGYYFLTNVSLLKSEYQAGDGVWRSTVFDIGYVANILAGKEFHLDQDNRKVLSVDVKLNTSGGRHIVPIDEEASLAANETRYDFENAYKEKVKDYFRTDLKISYAINRKKATHNIFVAADNILNTQNVLEQYWDRDEKKVKNEYQLGIFPYLGYKIQF